MRLRHPRLLSWKWSFGCALALVALFSVPSAALALRVADASATVDLTEAKARLKRASSFLRNKKSTGEEISHALRELASAHAQVAGTKSERAAFQRKAQAQLLRALTLYRAGRRTPDVNIRTEVNVEAARLLGALGATTDARVARTLSVKIRKAIETIAKKQEPEQWRQETLDAAFFSLAKLNAPASLQWMAENYTHTKAREVPFLIAAQKAMVQFRNVPGALRYAVFRSMRRAYAGVESVAMRNNGSVLDRARKRLWDALRTHAIPVLQFYSGAPRNEKDEALSTLAEFHPWSIEHKNPRRAPWTD